MLGNRFLAKSDYNNQNILWGSCLNTTKGRELTNLMQKCNYLYISTGSSTYWLVDPTKIPELLDFFGTKDCP